MNKRIIAIVLIVVIGVGVGVGAWLFLAPTGGGYAWSASDAPGAPTDITADQIIRLGVLSDTERIQGEGSYNGAELAVTEINEAGGIDIGGDTYYFGLTSENTDEGNPVLDTAVAVTAAKRLINYKQVQYAVGGFRTECVLAYQPLFMDDDIIFINVGAATTSLTQNVLDDYDNFKYFFHPSPQNTSILIAELIQLIMFTAYQMSWPVASGGLGHNISRFSFMLEDLAWTGLFASAITANLENNDYWNMTHTGVTITMPQDVTSIQMETYWDEVEDADTQIIIPIFSGAAGLTFSISYGANKPSCIPYGINVVSQDAGYWVDTAGAANYGVTMESVFPTNKTSLTETFHADYVAEYATTPIYTAVGAYDAVYQLAWAIEGAQTLDPDLLVTKLETLKRGAGNHLEGAGGFAAYTPGHSSWYGWPYGIGLAIQWVNGSKTLVPGVSVYPSGPWSGPIPPFGTLSNMVSIAVPDWGLHYFDTQY